MLETTSLFAGLMKKSEWLRERQEVLSQNIANADTPRYRPKDMETVNFGKIMAQRGLRSPLKTTNPRHFASANPFSTDTFQSLVQRNPFETSIDKNGVVLEEQASKMDETQMQHTLMVSLYKSNTTLYRTALGQG